LGLEEFHLHFDEFKWWGFSGFHPPFHGPVQIGDGF